LNVLRLGVDLSNKKRNNLTLLAIADELPEQHNASPHIIDARVIHPQFPYPPPLGHDGLVAHEQLMG
jgi:hypothetical protein